jgi:hypothetical protein
MTLPVLAKPALTSGRASAAMAASWSLAMISGGVPAGATYACLPVRAGAARHLGA